MSAMSMSMAAMAPVMQVRLAAKTAGRSKAAAAPARRSAVVLKAVTEPASEADASAVVADTVLDGDSDATAAAVAKVAAEGGVERKPRRKSFPKKEFTVKDADIAIGKEFAGKVKRVQDYGCFVDFGARSDGLVHISELKDGFVESVADVVTDGQDVTVWVKSIDLEKGRISLTMKPPPVPLTAQEQEAAFAQEAVREQQFKERKAKKVAFADKENKVGKLKKGQSIEGTVKSIQPFGAFVEISDGVEGLVHISEISEDYNVKIEDFCKVGAKVTVRVLGVDGSKVKLTMKGKIDLKEMQDELNVTVDSGAGAMAYALKSKGVTPAQFPGFAILEKAQKAAEEAAAAAAAAAPAEEAVAAVAAVAEAVVEAVAEVAAVMEEVAAAVVEEVKAEVGGAEETPA
eukprot:CAMPEP_0197574702 /NCGR_PEP_ID=MMETSP1326-20131121/351_1 /TAXON_ID=1155430 /ORGANISM="Genus nov. species nov., Strain RCC2288" /LENGTH=401 /DNA_ID=CAMNT_0043137333 /DNA_START=33 /DNA_END=1238 /DNA_ORIENTATION=-